MFWRVPLEGFDRPVSCNMSMLGTGYAVVVGWLRPWKRMPGNGAAGRMRVES